MFADKIRETMEVYIDDMLVKSLEAEDHVSHLQQAFSTLRKYNMKLNPAKCSFGVSYGKFLGYIMTHRGIEANPEQIRAIHSIPSPRSVKEVHKLTGIMAALSRFITRLSDKSHSFFKPSRSQRTSNGPRSANWLLWNSRLILPLPLSYLNPCSAKSYCYISKSQNMQLAPSWLEKRKPRNYQYTT